MKIAAGVLLLFALSGFTKSFAADGCPSTNHFAVNAWGLSYHETRNKGYNEQNWGLGLRWYHGCWFLAADNMRNSVRGMTLALGGGYEYPVTTIKGYTLSIAGQLTRLDYEVPGRGVAHGVVTLPFVSVKKDDLGLAGNIGIIPAIGRGRPVLLFFVTKHF